MNGAALVGPALRTSCRDIDYCRMNRIRLLAFATQGSGGDDEARVRALLENFPVDVFPFDRRKKMRTFLRLLRAIRRAHHDLIVMEGTGVAGGAAVLIGKLLFGARYVVSSGDAAAPFVAAQRPGLRPAFALYERFLYRAASGFIGWTPYLTGRAVSFGAPRAMTAPGWAPFTATPEDLARSRLQIRAALGIPADGLVVGIVGSLAWTKRVGYSYGLELVQALRRCERADAYALIVGDGDGRIRLEQRAGNDLGKRIILAGRVPREQVPHYLAAMDVASLPQSVDRVGSFRYTTKLSEYLAARLPVITGQIPLAYDLDDGWLWRLAGKAPWDQRYIEALANLIDRLTVDEIASKRSALLQKAPDFNRNRQVACVTQFVTDLLAERSGAIAVR